MQASNAAQHGLSSVQHVSEALEAQGYVADTALCTSVFLALKMGRPLLLEGAPGVGKTELARALSRALGTDLIRLQCYEGLDLAQAAYEWNYPRQLLRLQLAQRTALGAGASEPGTEAQEERAEALLGELYREEFLLRRPLLRAIAPDRDEPAVLLIDEVDRADEEFESFLLEVLSEYQITIPELGPIVAPHPPVVVVTSNRTRDVHDALKRRCLYQWVEYPSIAQEVRILRRKAGAVSEALARQIAAFNAALRSRDLSKPPGVAESIDWSLALAHLGVRELTEEAVVASAGCLLKVHEDITRLRSGLAREALCEAPPAGAKVVV